MRLVSGLSLCRPEKSIKYEYLACVNIQHKRDADIYRSQAELRTFSRRHDKHSPKLIHKNCTKNDKHMKSFMICTFLLSAYSLHKNFSRLNLQTIRSDSIALLQISNFSTLNIFFLLQTYFDLFLINFMYFSIDTMISHIPLGASNQLIPVLADGVYPSKVRMTLIPKCYCLLLWSCCH